VTWLLEDALEIVNAESSVGISLSGLEADTFRFKCLLLGAEVACVCPVEPGAWTAVTAKHPVRVCA
jgi:hypothetical protein